MNITTTTLTLLASTSPVSVMRAYVDPSIATLCGLAGLVSTVFLTTGGYHYMTSSGNPDNLANAKKTIKNALLGLVLVLAAATLTTILTRAYGGSSAAISSHLPNLTTLQPAPVSNGLLDILIKAVTGLLNNIIQTIASPILKALTFFTTSTPLMADNSAVFNLWLAMVGITDVVFTLVIALLGFHIMGASTLGFDEIEFRQLLPRIALAFVLINCSVFLIDSIISLSNAMINAVNAAGSSTKSVWDVLTNVVAQAGGQSVAGLLIMVAFLIFAVILLVYYVTRLVTLFIGAVLSPLVLLLWLVPGFRDFSETAVKVYLTTIFVLFVHVVILELAASLFTGMSAGSGTPDTLMAMVVGLATLIALLKTQGVMNQLSYVSLGPRTAKKLGGQFITGVSALMAGGRAMHSNVSNVDKTFVGRSVGTTVISSTKRTNQANMSQPDVTTNSPTSSPRQKTGETIAAPELAKPKPRKESNGIPTHAEINGMMGKLKEDKKALKGIGKDNL